jgi:hypothetical protein
MKTINETFTDAEFKELNEKKGICSWHDFIMLLTLYEEETKKEDN